MSKMDATMQICNKQKNCNTNLVIASVKKQITTQGKRQTRNINACKKTINATIKRGQKNAQYRCARQKQTWPTETATILEKRNSRSKFLKIKKISILIG